MPADTPNPFDQACRRHLLRRGGLALLAWLLRREPSELHFVRWLDTRLSVPGQPERVCDTIAHVRRLDQGGVPWAVPVEFQAAPDELMLGRVLMYQSLVWLREKPTGHPGDRFCLQSVVVNLTGAGRTGQCMVWGVGMETTLLPVVWNFAELDAAVVLEQIVVGDAPMYLLPFVSLMINGGEPATIKRWLDVANREADTYRKSDFALVVVLSQLTKCERVWQKAPEGFNVLESVIVNEWKAQAASRATRKAVITVLEARFGPLPADAKSRIEATDAQNALDDWVALTGKAASLDDFRRDAGV